MDLLKLRAATQGVLDELDVPPAFPHRSPQRAIYCSRTLNLRSIKCIGYDMASHPPRPLPLLFLFSPSSPLPPLLPLPLLALPPPKQQHLGTRRRAPPARAGLHADPLRRQRLGGAGVRVRVGLANGPGWHGECCPAGRLAKHPCTKAGAAQRPGRPNRLLQTWSGAAPRLPAAPAATQKRAQPGLTAARWQDGTDSPVALPAQGTPASLQAPMQPVQLLAARSP
jgi:hypothetical protein